MEIVESQGNPNFSKRRILKNEKTDFLKNTKKIFKKFKGKIEPGHPFQTPTNERGLGRDTDVRGQQFSEFGGTLSADKFHFRVS